MAAATVSECQRNAHLRSSPKRRRENGQNALCMAVGRRQASGLVPSLLCAKHVYGDQVGSMTRHDNGAVLTSTPTAYAGWLDRLSV